MPKRLPRVVKPLLGAEPDWNVLRRVVRAPHDRDFVCLWVGRMSDGVTVTAFAHTYTGRILFLGDDGCAFTPTPAGRYRAVKLSREVMFALPCRSHWIEIGGYAWDDVGPEPWPEDDLPEMPFGGDLAF